MEICGQGEHGFWLRAPSPEVGRSYGYLVSYVRKTGWAKDLMGFDLSDNEYIIYLGLGKNGICALCCNECYES
jgi:hypothetical protein